MCSLPERNYTARWAVARKLYECGPQSGPELIALFEVDPRGRRNFLVSLEKMRVEGNLLLAGRRYELSDDLAACLAEEGELRRDCAQREIATPRTVRFRPLDLGKYPHLKTASHGDAHFVSMSSRVRVAEDAVGEW